MRYRFLCPWRFERAGACERLAHDFLARIQPFRGAELISPKATPPDATSAAQFLIREIEKIDGPGQALLCLDERGKTQTSEGFAQLLDGLASQGFRGITFTVGGAYGVPANLPRLGKTEIISLSSMTFPHEMAMVLLLEQVYRAHCILAGHPYHHGAPSELIQVSGGPQSHAAATRSRLHPKNSPR